MKNGGHVSIDAADDNAILHGRNVIRFPWTACAPSSPAASPDFRGKVAFATNKFIALRIWVIFCDVQ
jgi:hypothetical protein